MKRFKNEVYITYIYLFIYCVNVKYLREMIVARICATALFIYSKYRSVGNTVSTSLRVRVVQVFYTLIANGYIFLCRTVIINLLDVNKYI